MADRITVGEGTISLIKGDISDLEFDAFVFYAANNLMLGAGFGTAISMRGGPKIQEALKELAPVETGQAVVTEGGNLKAKYIVHAIGPKFQEEDVPGKLKRTMESALKAAEEKDIESLAFPAMGVGFYGVALDTCAGIMYDALIEYLKNGGRIKDITICVLDNREYLPFAERLKAVAGQGEYAS
jgi:O-acetyl-ADP-ribose deacetylase (regulator of RNase III)